jgi:hypothetical protein
MECSKVVEKAKITLIVENVEVIKVTNIILNAKIVEVNFVLNVQRTILTFLIILVLYVEKNSPKDVEDLLIVVKAKITLIAGNVEVIKVTNIILNAKIVEVNFALNVRRIILIFLIILVLYVESNFQEDMEDLKTVVKARIIMIVGNVVDIKRTNIILNAKIAEVNFALLVHRIKYIILIIYFNN